MQTSRYPTADEIYGYWNRWWTFTVLAGLWLVLTVFFNAHPELDILITENYFQPMACQDGSSSRVCGLFPMEHDAFWFALREFNRTFPVAVTVIVALYAIWRWHQEGSLADPRIRIKFTLMWTMIVGPLLITNALFKQNWGRPRPLHTELFGGKLPFVPAGEKTSYCPDNCSFISGEASSAFWMVCFAFIVPRRYRKVAIILALAFAIFASWLRVAFGKHFFSDVVLGGLATMTVFALLSWVDRLFFVRSRPVPATD